MTALLTPGTATSRRHVQLGLVVLTALSWLYLILLSVRMGDMGSSLAMPMTSAWTGADVVLMWTMWAVMMAAMMLPSAAPMITVYDSALGNERAGLSGSTPLFVAGYLAVWAGFAATATAVQWLLHDAAVVSAMGESTNTWLGGSLLLGAGVYQFTGVKDACVSHCRSPLSFIMNEWRPGLVGALRMGARHGTYCVGCCWVLMALLFVLGVMNLWWIAVLAAVVLLEKVLPSVAVTRAVGVGLAAWGIGLLIGIG